MNLQELKSCLQKRPELNLAIALPDGRHIMSYMSIAQWYNDVNIQWRTNYAGLAISNDGNSFQRTPTVWWNDGSNTDPFQMWTMQRDGDWVYVFSVRAGRQQSCSHDKGKEQSAFHRSSSFLVQDS